jgi:hypothetical protein
VLTRTLIVLFAAATLGGATASAQAAVALPARSGATARASTASQARVNPDACDFTPNFKTSHLKESAQGPAPTGGTIGKFPSGTSCKDLNLSYVSATDGYQGWLENSHTGHWAACAAGYVHIKGGSQSTTNPPVLCTDVLPGTLFAVVQQSSTQRTVTVED